MRRWWWAALLGIGILAVIVLDDTQHLGPLQIVYRIPYGDKAAHFGLFGLLSMALNLAAFAQWPRLPRPALSLRLSGGLAALIALEEMSQSLFPQRTASIWDVAAGYLGIAVFTSIALLLANRRHPGPLTK